MKNEVTPKGEMTEKNLFKTAKIFWPKGEWETQVRYYYDPSNRRKFYLVDCCSKLKKIVFEYEGPQHYENVWKLKRDEEREAYFTGIGYKFFRWPYYCQLTRDVAKYYFANDYSEEKYLQARDYKIHKGKIGLISSSISFLITISFLIFNGYGILDEYISSEN